MSVDLYSSRNAPPCKELDYRYLKPACRFQIAKIATAFFEQNHMEGYAEEYIWPTIQKILKDEHATDSLYREAAHKSLGGRIAPSAEVIGYLQKQDDINKSLDTIELIFRVISNIETVGPSAGYPLNNYPPSQAIDNLNKRLAQHCMGFKFDGGVIIRIDNELLYSTITKDLMIFLSNSDYHNINQEYMQAHKHFRDGNYKDCIVNCAKAFESSMKVICDKKSYTYDLKATAAPLLKVLYDNKFIPEYIQTNLGGLRSVLVDGVSVVRNKTSSHGAGSAVIDVSEELAAYVLNTAGSTIKFLLAILEK
ncbi:MAG TPA: hypothetical protein VGM30_14885 [Puia sp.]|jgi:hypothetical protein